MKLFKRTVSLLLILIIISSLITGFYSYIPDRNLKVTSSETRALFSILESENIDISKTVIPKEYPNLPDILLSNSLNERTLFAEKLLDKNFSVYDNTTYTDSDSTLVIDGNLFTVYFNEDNYMKDKIKKAKDSELSDIFSSIVNSFGFKNTIISLSETNATVMMTYKKIPILNSCFRVHYSKNGISEIEGICFEPTGIKYQKKRRALINVFNEISNNPEISGKTITDISIGYKIDEFSEFRKEAVAYPVWRITVDDEISYDYKM